MPVNPKARHDKDAAQLDAEIAAFDLMRPDLEAHHLGKWVVVRGGVLAGTFDTLDNAATFAQSHFGRGPYLIRQIGAPLPSLPISLAARLSAA